MPKHTLFIILLSLFICSSLGAQEPVKVFKIADEEKVDEVIDWAWPGKFYPFIEATMGVSQLSHDGFQGNIPEESLIEIKLGYSQLQEYEKKIWELDERFVSGSYLADNIFSSLNLNQGDFTAKISRFGFGNRLGYGYHLKPFIIILYNQNGMNWTQIKTGDDDAVSDMDKAILDRYQNTYRFGMNGEGGIRLALFKSLSLAGSYEMAAVYPRHVFWPWLGSYIMYQIGLGVVSSFTDDIIRSSPAAGPVFYFILKNALTFAYYKGVSSKMNWPFNSEIPMMLETFKFGLSYTF